MGDSRSPPFSAPVLLHSRHDRDMHSAAKVFPDTLLLEIWQPCAVPRPRHMRDPAGHENGPIKHQVRLSIVPTATLCASTVVQLETG